MQRVPEESILPLAEDSHRPWYLLGIVSFGTCGASNPGMFTRLGSHFILKWFENRTIILHIQIFFFRTEKFVPWIRENIRD